MCSWGDAAVDADLYSGLQGRKDFEVYESLYGLAPQVVSSIGNYSAIPEKLNQIPRLSDSEHKGTLCALNIHPRVIASKYQTGTKRFYELFKTFIKVFRDSGYDQCYLDGIPTGCDAHVLGVH